MTLSYNQLLIDLRTAYHAASRHKHSKDYCVEFASHLDVNLRTLADDIYSRLYRPLPPICFVIEDPKKREVFAAMFRDRVVHHLYYNYVHELFERNFIVDSYSCIKKRGTHYGINRLEQHIRRESLNYTELCYILKMDISGYFMHINRQILLNIVIRRLSKMRRHKIHRAATETWNDILDVDFLTYLSQEIIMYNPADNCVFRGKKSDWATLPHSRSLFYSPKDCGLPIGNLTSQLFSNVYLGEFDDYMKRTLKIHRYGRYVDDFYVVSNDRDYLLSIVPKIEDFLTDKLKLQINTEKTVICDSNSGVGFLGAFLKPHRRYIHNHSLRRIKSKIPNLAAITDKEKQRSVYASYRGILSHYSSLSVKADILLRIEDCFNLTPHLAKKPLIADWDFFQFAPQIFKTYFKLLPF